MKKDDYIKTMKNIHMPDEMRARILHRMAQNNTKEVPISMMTRNKKKMAAVLVAAMAVGGSAFAFSGTISSIFSSSSSDPDYTSLPTAQQCEQDAGFAPALVQDFDNGFTFKDGTIVSNQEQNEDGQTVNKYVSLDFTYQKGDQTVTLAQDKDAQHDSTEGSCIAQKDGVSYYETTKTEKYVSESYLKTEQDKLDEASGDVEFNVADSDAIHAGQNDNGVETDTYHGVNWTANGVHYSLYQINGSLTSDQMLDMAQQITAAAE